MPARSLPRFHRQLDLFEAALGYPPDHIDGHQHVHALPVVRQALIDVVARRYPVTPPMLRDPADTKDNIRARGLAVRKALIVNALTRGSRMRLTPGACR